MESVHLTGADRVEHAAREIVGAADTMLRAVGSYHEAVSRQQQMLEEFMRRMEAIAEKLIEVGRTE